ncbi:hypothetical protein D9M73_206370 [compost metagenome]
MLAEATILAVVHVATGEAAQVIDLHHRLGKGALRRRLQGMALEQRVGHRQRATGEKAAAQAHRRAFDAQHIFQRTGCVRRAVCLLAVAQLRSRQGLRAELRIVLQTPELISRQQVRRFTHIKHRPGIPGIRQAPALTPGIQRQANQHQAQQQ